MDFDELEVTPEIEEKLWVKHRVLVDEVEEVLFNPHIEKRKPGDRQRRYVYGRRTRDALCSLLWSGWVLGDISS